jgi:hypothetical protein
MHDLEHSQYLRFPIDEARTRIDTDADARFVLDETDDGTKFLERRAKNVSRTGLLRVRYGKERRERKPRNKPYSRERRRRSLSPYVHD